MSEWRAVDLRHQKGGQIRIFDPQDRHVANVNAHNEDCAEIAARIVSAMNHGAREQAARLEALKRAIEIVDECMHASWTSVNGEAYETGRHQHPVEALEEYAAALRAGEPKAQGQEGAK